jgi:cation diffusion facilitator CzcD-associated flavoprotein CzcO
LRGIVDEYNLTQYIKFEHSICGTEWLEEDGKWKVSVKGPDGLVKVEICDVFLNAGGVLK